MTRLLRLLPAIFCLLLPIAVHGGVAAPDYSKEAFVITSTDTVVRFAADGSSRRIQTTVIKMLSDAGVRFWGVLAFPYASEEEQLEVNYVRVRKAGGNVVGTNAESILDLPAPVTEEAPMYSDLKQKRVPVKALGVGDSLEFQVTSSEIKPLVPGQFWLAYQFTRTSVVLSEVLEIHTPASTRPKVVSATVRPSIHEDKLERVYRWETAHTEPTGSVKDEPAQAEPPKMDIQMTTFDSWAQVGDWYGKLSRPAAAVTPAIRAKALELISGKATQQEQIEAIYSYVSTQFRYIGLSFGIGRYRPHNAAEVLDNQYGDCKDKDTLLTALLNSVGIDAWPALMNSSRKIDEDVPSPAQFDHVITVVPQGKDVIWLDTTPEVAPYRVLFAMLRDKQALVMPSSGEPRLMKTPAELPFPASNSFTMRGSLNGDDVLKSHAELVLRGDSEMLYRAAFHGTASAQWQQLMQNLAGSLGFAGEVSNVQAGDPLATGQPFHVSWDYMRKSYGDWDNRQIGAPMPGAPFDWVDQEKQPSQPIDVGDPGTTVYTTEIELPTGSAMQAPANVDVKTAFAEYHAKYSVTNGKFLAERRFLVLQKQLPVAKWGDAVAFQKEVQQDYSRMNSISVTGSSLPPGGSGDDPEAGALVQQAAQYLQNQQAIAAEDALEKAKKLNPNQTNLNAMYAFLYLLKNNRETALESFRAEIRAHPDNVRVLRIMARTFREMTLPQYAMETDRSILKVIPDDIDANSDLAEMLVQQERWKEAQPVLDKLVKLRPDSSEVEMWYGEACLANGSPEAGVLALTKAIGAISDPRLLAGMATSIAQSGKAPELAKSTARKALSTVESETSSIDISQISDADLKKMLDLAQAWDSFGFVALEAGDTATAERYARAAWLLGQTPLEGEHLGQIYERENRLPLALDTYKMALHRGFPSGGQIERRIAHLEEQHVKSSTRSSPGVITDTLSNLRCVRLPSNRTVNGAADFFVLFADGKIEAVKRISGEAAFDRYGAALRRADYGPVIPDTGPERVVRRGTLSCSVYDPHCLFWISLPEAASASVSLHVMAAER